MNKPKGIFSSAGAFNSNVEESSQNRGILIRAKWSDIEPSLGNFNFDSINHQVNAVKPSGKKYSLAILAGPFTPTFRKNNLACMSYAWQGSTISVPKIWDTATEPAKQLQPLAQALGAAYNGDPSLSLVYVSQFTSNGIEGHFNGASNSLITASGYSADGYASETCLSIGYFRQYFPDHAVAIELHDILQVPDAASQILTALDDSSSGVGAALWWLSGKNDYQADLLSLFQSFGGDKYAQLIDKSSNISSFLNGDYSTAFIQARTLGVRCCEAWDYEFMNPPGGCSPQWNSAFNSYNQWVDEVFV